MGKIKIVMLMWLTMFFSTILISNTAESTPPAPGNPERPTWDGTGDTPPMFSPGLRDGKQPEKRESDDSSISKPSKEEELQPIQIIKPVVNGMPLFKINQWGYPEYRHEQTGLVFVLIPKGTLEIESAKSDNEEQKPGLKNNKKSKNNNLKKVDIDSFLISKFEVSRTAWEKIMTPASAKKTTDEYPIERVSWEKSQEFCQKTGLRLPSELEWEYAYRAGTKTQYYWGTGDKKNGNYMWYADNSENRSHPVGQKQPNKYGLYDMSGNLREWCQNSDQEAAANGVEGILRGGAYSSDKNDSSATFRVNPEGISADYAGVGFRCVMDLK